MYLRTKRSQSIMFYKSRYKIREDGRALCFKGIRYVDASCNIRINEITDEANEYNLFKKEW